MIKFMATTQNLKKALSIAALATGDTTNNIHSHALFSISYDAVTLFATNEDKISVARFPLSGLESDEDSVETKTLFTAEPKRIQALITNSDITEIRFEYDHETKTLNVYASENPKAYISFASFDPATFLSFEEDLTQRDHLKNVPAGVFLTGIKFIQGFLPNDDKNKKFSNLYLDKGVMFGSNGSNKIGAFLNKDFSEMPTLVLRKIMLPPITTLIDKLDLEEVSIKSSEKFLTFSSPDDQFCFGFRNSTLPMIKFPIPLEVPLIDGFNIERTPIQKKLSRLALSSWEDIGVEISIKGEKLLMETATDRKSYESVDCARISGEKDINFIVECDKFKTILNLYSASNVDVYIDKKTCTIFSSGDIITEEKDGEVKKEFTAIGLLTLARVI